MKIIRLCVTNNIAFDQRLHRMAKTLQNEGYLVHLIGRKSQKDAKSTIEFDAHLLSCWFNTGPLFYLEFNIRLFCFLLFKKTDILVANDADTLLACGMISFIRNCKLVYDSHEWFTEVPELIGHTLKQKMWHLIQKIFVSRSDLCLTVGPQLASKLSSIYKMPFYSIRNLPYHQERLKIKKINNHIMIYQGTLNVGRGIEQSIEALKQLPNWKLWIVGVGPIRNQLDDLVSRLEVSDQVIFYGGMIPSELQELTPLASVGINLLKGESGNYYYSLANKYFDYVQAGIPTITMDFPEYRSHNREHNTSVLIEKCTVNDLIDAIKTLEESSIYHELVDICHAASKEWNWETEREKLNELYHVLSNPNK